jgi:hypothetical protein
MSKLVKGAAIAPETVPGTQQQPLPTGKDIMNPLANQ